MDSVRKLFAPAVTLAAVCVVVLFSGVAVAGEPGSLRAAGKVGAPIGSAACDRPGEGVQCARIRVPLDWDRPRGRTISLELVRHLASKPDERIGMAFINPGGPAIPAWGW